MGGGVGATPAGWPTNGMQQRRQPGHSSTVDAAGSDEHNAAYQQSQGRHEYSGLGHTPRHVANGGRVADPYGEAYALGPSGLGHQQSDHDNSPFADRHAQPMLSEDDEGAQATDGQYAGGLDDGEVEVRLRERHSSFRRGPSMRIQRHSSTNDSQAASAPPQRHKGRRRWAGPSQDEHTDHEGVRDGGDGSKGAGYGSHGGPGTGGDGSGPPGGAAANTGHMVRMKRSEAWGKFLAYEGCCQVCMKEGAKGTQDAFYFLSSGCAPLRSGLGIQGLLLPPVLAAHMASSIDAGEAIDIGNEIMWDDHDASDKKLGAAAFVSHMSLLKVRVAKLVLPGRGFWSKLTCKRNATYTNLTVHLKLVPSDARCPLDMRFRLGAEGCALPGSPVYDLQPDQSGYEFVLEVSDGTNVVARGAIPCKRVWQIGMEHAQMGDGESADGSGSDGGEHGNASGSGGICKWFKDSTDVTLRQGATGLWVNVFNQSQGRSGQVLIEIHRQQREMPQGAAADGQGDGGATSKPATLKVSACQSYDHLLTAALKAQGCGEKRLEVTGEWDWLLRAFAGHYGVRSNYALMSHLRWVLKPGVASVSRPCFDLLTRELRPLLEQEAMGGSLTQQEATMLGKIKRDVEELLKLAFENYYLLSSAARKGIVEGTSNPPASEFPPEALVAGMHLYEAMRDVFHPSDGEWLADRFRVAAKTRWQRLACSCDDGHGSMQESACAPSGGLSAPLRQHRPISKGGAPLAGKAQQLYARMSSIGLAIADDLDYDQRLQQIPRLLPSSLNLAAITAAEYCTNYVHQLRSVLANAPPNQPTQSAIDLLVSVAGLQRTLEERGLSLPRGHPGCLDAMELFGHHVRSWITTSQENLNATCRNLEATTELSTHSAGATQPAMPLGSSEEGGVAPIVHEMLRHVVNEMHRYERVIAHWPLFGPYLEAALCVVLRTVVGSVSRQCGMVRVRNAHGNGAGSMGGAQDTGAAAGKGANPAKRRGQSALGVHGTSDQQGPPPSRHGKMPSSMPQWAWQPGTNPTDSPRHGNGSARAVLPMVREAVLLNSLKRLMVAVPNYEGTINRWGGGASAPPPGMPHPACGSVADVAGAEEDVAPHVGAQFAQVVKELRTEYAAAVASTSERMSAALAASPHTSLKSLLTAAANRAAGASSLQQSAMMEAMSETLFATLDDSLASLQAALDSRVFVAMGRGLWDFIGRELFEYVENLQESKEHKGAWRARQNASILLGFLNNFFKAALLGHMEHTLQERDLAVPLHIDATQKLLAQSTTALNNSYTPF